MCKWGKIKVLEFPYESSRTPGALAMQATEFGQHKEDILKLFTLGGEIADLKRNKVI